MTTTRSHVWKACSIIYGTWGGVKSLQSLPSLFRRLLYLGPLPIPPAISCQHHFSSKLAALAAHLPGVLSGLPRNHMVTSELSCLTRGPTALNFQLHFIFSLLLRPGPAN